LPTTIAPFSEEPPANVALNVQVCDPAPVSCAVVEVVDEDVLEATCPVSTVRSAVGDGVLLHPVNATAKRLKKKQEANPEILTEWITLLASPRSCQQHASVA
jgi:hypothetical protein